MHTLPEKIGIVNELIAYMQNPDSQTALKAKNLGGRRAWPGCKASSSPESAWGAAADLEVQKQNKTAEAQTAAYDAYNNAERHAGSMIGLLGEKRARPRSSRPSAAACATCTARHRHCSRSGRRRSAVSQPKLVVN